MLISQMLKENIQISSILVKEENIELQIERGDHIVGLKKGRKKPKSYKAKGKIT
jgi:hypothetical protein